jgi:hypothetical protein
MALVLWLFAIVPLLAQQLPALNWEPRSDWINVQTDIVPSAVGDVVADDTAAIQAALNQVSEHTGTPATVFCLPALTASPLCLSSGRRTASERAGCGVVMERH